jgi:hypothetical protein
MNELINTYLSSDVIVGLPDGSVWKFSDSLDPETHKAPEGTCFVITACNPRGFHSSLEDNHEATVDLEEALTSKSLRYGIGWGQDSDNTHFEVGFCVPTTNENLEDTRFELQELAVRFHQNAIFEIEGNVVTLLPGVEFLEGQRVKGAIKIADDQDREQAALQTLRWMQGPATPAFRFGFDRVAGEFGLIFREEEDN